MKFKPGDKVRMIPPERIGPEFNKGEYKLFFLPGIKTIKRCKTSGIDGQLYYETYEDVRFPGFNEACLEHAITPSHK